MADLRGYHRAQTGQDSIKGPGKVLRGACYQRFEFLFTDCERILFFSGMGNKPVASGKDLTYRTDLCRNVLNAVKNHVIFVTENDITVFSHELDNERFPAQVGKLVKMFDFNTDDPFQGRLCDGDDAAV